MNSLRTERILTIVLAWATAVAVTWAFHWIDPAPTDASLFSAVLAYWRLFFIFYYGLFLGLGSGDQRQPEDTVRVAVGSALAFVGTITSVALSMTLTETGALGVNEEVVLSLLPLHWGFVWLVLMQHLRLV